MKPSLDVAIRRDVSTAMKRLDEEERKRAQAADEFCRLYPDYAPKHNFARFLGALCYCLGGLFILGSVIFALWQFARFVWDLFT